MATDYGEPPHLIAPELLASGLASPQERIRAITAWYIALRYRSGRGAGVDLLTQTLDATPPHESSSPDLLAGLVLARRALGAKPDDDPAVLEYSKMGKPMDKMLPVYDQGCRLQIVRDLLTEAEVRANQPLLDSCTVTRLSAQARDAERQAEDAKRNKTQANRWFPITKIMAIGDLPKGMLQGVLEEAGCALTEKTKSLVGTSSYSFDGRAERVELPRGVPSDGCGTALRALLSATRGNPGETRILILPLRPGPVACIDQFSDPWTRKVDEDADRNAEVVTTQSIPKGGPRWSGNALVTARNAIVSAVVSETGCVASASDHFGPIGPPEVGLATVDAVLGWQFKPALREGVPVRQSISLKLDLMRRELAELRVAAAHRASRWTWYE